VIARCLAAEPVLLVADEPTASLDDESKERVLGLLKELAQDPGLAVLLISHDLQTVARVCDRVLRLSQGRVVNAEAGPLGGIGTKAAGGA
jgi:peptide/nickel transport system ATP-binding protein